MNLLIVDDEIEMIRGIMSGVDWKRLNMIRVYEVTGVEKAKAEFTRRRIDIALCDIEMTDGSGLDLLDWIKVEYPDTACVIISCHEEFEYARRAVGVGCKSYIVKPVIYKELEERIFDIAEEIEKSKVDLKYRNFGRDWVKKISEDGETSSMDCKEMTETVKRYIRTHLKEELTSESLSALVYITPDYLFRIFKREERVTLWEFILEERMFLAEQLLKESSLTVSRIAYECGYDNFSYFAKVFKKKYGVTPRDYRK
ncbi:response regulator transcription factor [Robinsoniella peoriensis]